MKVFVVGATGVVGRRAVDQLVTAGHAVTGVARSAEKAASLTAAGAAAAQIDPFDRSALIAATGGHHALVNLATHIPGGRDAARRSAWDENNRIRREISANLAAAATANGAARLVQESIVLPYVDAGERWIDEHSPVNPAPALESTVAAQQVALAAESDITAPVVLRFGLFYAPDAAQIAEQAAITRRGMAPVLGGPRGYISTIDADDAAAAVVAALDVPAGIYNVVDNDPLTRAEYATAMAVALGVKRTSFAVARTGALAGDKRTGGMIRSLRVSNVKFKQAADWEPRWPTGAQGLATAVAQNVRIARA